MQLARLLCHHAAVLRQRIAAFRPVLAPRPHLQTLDCVHPTLVRARRVRPDILRRPTPHPESLRGGRWAFTMLYAAAFAIGLLGAGEIRGAVDYQVFSVSMNTNRVGPGDWLTVTVVIKNIGSTAATKDSEVVLRFVPESARPISLSPQVAKFTIPALAAGGFVEKQVVVPVPNVSDGIRYLWAIADNSSVLGQSSTAVANDFGRGAAITVAAQTPTTAPTTPATTPTTSPPSTSTTPTTTTTTPPATPTNSTPVSGTTSTASSATRIEIAKSWSFVATPGTIITLRGTVQNSRGAGVTGVDVWCEDAITRASVLIGKTDATGSFEHMLGVPNATALGNYAMAYIVGSVRQTAVVTVTTPLLANQFVLKGPSLDFQPGPLTGTSADLPAYANSTQAVILTESQLRAKAQKLLDAVGAASLDELKSRAGDPATYVLVAAGAACAVPQIAVAAAPACAVVYQTIISEAQVSAFRIAAHSAVKLSTLPESDKKVVDDIIDGVLSVRSAVSLAASGSLNRFDFYSGAWDASKTLLEIKRRSDGAVEQVDIVGLGRPAGQMSQLRLCPLTPYKPVTTTATTPTVTPTTTPVTTTTTPSTTTTPAATTPTTVTSTPAPPTTTTTAKPTVSTTPTTTTVTATPTPTGTSTPTSPTNAPTTSSPAFTSSTTPVPAATTAATPAPTGSKLVAIAVRSRVGPGSDTLIAGIVVSGTQPKRVLIRAVGPSLRSLGVDTAVSDPSLKVFAGATLIAANDDWASSPTLLAATAAVGLNPLVTGSKDAALSVDLAPGVYTAQLISAHAGTGMIECYEVP